MALPRPVVEPPPRATVQSAPVARTASGARPVTSTGVCVAASAKTPADRSSRRAAIPSASGRCCGVESTSAPRRQSARTSSSTRARVPAPNTTRAGSAV